MLTAVWQFLGELLDALIIGGIGVFLLAGVLFPLYQWLPGLIREHNSHKLGRKLGKVALFLFGVSNPALSMLMMVGASVDKKNAWWSNHVACQDPVHAQNWNAAGLTTCRDAANHNRWTHTVWAGDVRSRGVIGLYLDHNALELFHMFVHQNIGVQAVTTGVLWVIPILTLVYVYNRLRSDNTNATVKDGEVCWTTPDGKIKCSRIRDSKDEVKKLAATGPSE